MAKLTPAEFSEKWARRLSQSEPDITRGVNRVTESPPQKAAQNMKKMYERWLEAFNSGKIEAGLNRVDLGTWKKDMLEKGIPNLRRGIERGTPKVQQFATELLSYQDSLLAQLENMPDLTFEDSKSRVLAWMDGMHKFTRR